MTNAREDEGCPLERALRLQRDAEQALRNAEALLEAERADGRLLQEISAQLIGESSGEQFCERLLDAAVHIMRSDFGSMQMLHPERGSGGELRLLAFRGFTPEAARFWHCVRVDSASSCGKALGSNGERVVVPDIEQCAFMAGTDDLEAYRQTGIRSVQTTPLLARSGKCVGMISTHWRDAHRPSEREFRLLDVVARQAADLIEHLNAQEALRQREERLRAIFDCAAVGAAILTREWRFIRVNDAFCTITGYSPDELAALTCSDITHPDDVAEAEALVEQVLAGRTPRVVIEKRYRRKDGELIWVQNSVSMTRDAAGMPLHLIAVAQDITAQVRSRAEIAESEERFRTLVAVTTDIAWTADPDGRFVAAQPAWSAYTGQDCAELLGFGWTNALHPEDRLAIHAAWTRARDARTLYESQGRLWHAASARYRYFIVRATPIFRSDGSVREWVGACTDVHDRRLAEEMLRESNRRKDEFLAQLAHELRNPLAPIRNAAQLLGFAGAGAPDSAWIRDVIERQVGHLTRLIDDLLDVSRVTRGKLELRKAPVALADVVQAAVETANPVIAQYGHELVVSLPSWPVQLHGDLVRLAQVLMNLITNGAKYSAPGGRIVLTAEIAPTHDGVNREVVVSVKDSGIGISAHALPHVFDMFYQVDASLDRSRGGLGIGLSLARRLVELHGGSVSAHSDGPGKGSEFVVRLPVRASGAIEASAQRHDDIDAHVAPSRILVVDDNRDAADALATLLRLDGHDVHLAHDGAEAVDTASAICPDVVLLDIGMPKLNGYDACRRIRDTASGKRIALFALTGFGQRQDRNRSEDAGFDGHFVKPIDLDALRKRIASLAAHR